MKKIVLNLMIIVAVCTAAGSRRGDSLALVAIQEANLSSELSWNYDLALDRWYQITLKDGRVDALFIHRKSIDSIPAAIGNLTELTRLNLNSNSIKTLPVEIWGLPKLVDLDIGGNELTTIPSDIGNFTELTALVLAGNLLTTLPDEIWSLTKLTKLYLGSNFLGSIPSGISSLTLLTELFINKCGLSTLPDELWTLTNLRELNLSKNQLTSVSDNIEKLVNLTNLDFRSNSLSNLPLSITLLTPSTSLDVSYNQFFASALSPDLVSWLNQYDRNWRNHQYPSTNLSSLANFNRGQINLRKNNISFEKSGTYTITILSAKGQLVKKITGSEMSVSLNSLGVANGVYQIRVVQGAEVFTGQFILR